MEDWASQMEEEPVEASVPDAQQHGAEQAWAGSGKHSPQTPDCDLHAWVGHGLCATQAVPASAEPGVVCPDGIVAKTLVDCPEALEEPSPEIHVKQLARRPQAVLTTPCPCPWP